LSGVATDATTSLSSMRQMRPRKECCTYLLFYLQSGTTDATTKRMLLLSTYSSAIRCEFWPYMKVSFISKGEGVWWRGGVVQCSYQRDTCMF